MNKKTLKNTIICAVCLILVLSLSGCSISLFGLHFGKRPSTDPGTADVPEATNPGLPEYYHYDSSRFLSDCDKMLSLYKEGKTEEAFALYKELDEELLIVDELQGTSYVLYSENVNDEYYSDENDYSTETLVTVSDALFSACHEMISGSYQEEFKAFLGDEKYISEYQDYEPMDKEQIDLFSRETDLIQQYYSQADGMMDTSCTFNGKTYTFDDVLGDDAAKLYYQDADLYMQVYLECLRKYNGLVGETFMELVDVRTKIAKSYGYDNYADYADAEEYEREYSVSDLEVMKNAIKDYGGDIDAFTSYFTTDSDFYYTDSADLISKVGALLSDISPLAEDSFNYFLSNKLYSIGDEDERMDGGYTIYLSKSQKPYIYIKTDGTAQAAITLAHEFGHFTAFHQVSMPYPTIDSGSLDLEETHSQGLQLLFTERADSLFGKYADSIKAYNVMRVLSAVHDGCVLDDWQREVYAHPDMTLDEINNCFRRIEEEYGVSYTDGLEYFWCDIPHNFENPMYYISYAVSALGALQIWAISQKNYDRAVSAWESLIQQGPYDNDYFSVMKTAGLKSFNERAAVKDILEDAVSYLYRAYTGNLFQQFGNYGKDF